MNPVVIVNFLLLKQNTWNLQFKKENVYFQLWYSEVSIHSQLAARQRHQGGWAYWKKSVQFVLSRKQEWIGKGLECQGSEINYSSPDHIPITHFCNQAPTPYFPFRCEVIGWHWWGECCFNPVTSPGISYFCQADSHG